mmetsp:Transcript_8381/g.25178  ORF Transcript_8381/g.25178 Transcript_8381/m.25178 type:complete len:107 (+) Transcript_8381:195-515(+)
MEQIKDYGVEDHTRWWLETKNYENKLDHLARGEDVGPVSRGMCIDLLDKLDATGMSVSLSSLPPACLKQHAYESESHIALRRRNTVQRAKEQSARLAEHAEHHVHS